MLQADESEHVSVLFAPTCNLQIACMLHVACESAPSLKSQFDAEVQVTALWSPPAPLHSEVSLHVTISESVELPWHFDACVHTSEHASS
jgi:hypothetical protein